MLLYSDDRCLNIKMRRIEKLSCPYSRTQNCLYSYSEQKCPLLDIWEDFKAGDEVVAVSHHATCDEDELSVVRGEILTFMVQHGDNFCKVKNFDGRIGFLPLSHISLKEDFQNEPWYLEVCTRKMADAVVNTKELGSFLVWRSDECHNTMIITVKSQTCVEHLEFEKKGNKLIFEERVYRSLYHVIDEFRKEKILVNGIEVTFPFRTANNNFKITVENLIVTGTSQRAIKDFKWQKKIQPCYKA